MRTPKDVNITLYATCTSIGINEFNNLMAGTTKANGKQIRRLIKRQYPKLAKSMCLEFRNPYEHKCVKKQGLLVYVHSAIEYFFTY